MYSFVPSAITHSFFELQTPDFAWNFVWTVRTNNEKFSFRGVKKWGGHSGASRSNSAVFWSYRLQILHRSSYAPSNQIRKFKSTKRTKVQKYKNTKVQKYKKAKKWRKKMLKHKKYKKYKSTKKGTSSLNIALRYSFSSYQGGKQFLGVTMIFEG